MGECGTKERRNRGNTRKTSEGNLEGRTRLETNNTSEHKDSLSKSINSENPMQNHKANRYYNQHFPQNSNISNKIKKSILHYNVIRTCGIGFYSKVYLCESTKNKTKNYAVKTLKKKNINNEKANKHIFNEIKLLNNIKFDFIIPIIDKFELNQREYMVFPYYNLDLFTFIRLEKKQIPENIIRIIISQIYSCISYLHKNQIIYRDLKPENVMLDIEEGCVKLIDFGLACTCKETEEIRELCGTNEYIPPEVIRRNPYSYDFDEWTYGIFCYEVVFGMTPFKGESQSDVFHSILSDEVEYPTHKRECSDELLELLKTLIVKDTTERTEWVNIAYHPFFLSKQSSSTTDAFEFLPNIDKPIKKNNEFRKELSSYLKKYKNHIENIVEFDKVERNKM